MENANNNYRLRKKNKIKTKSGDNRLCVFADGGHRLQPVRGLRDGGRGQEPEAVLLVRGIAAQPESGSAAHLAQRRYALRWESLREEEEEKDEGEVPIALTGRTDGRSGRVVADGLPLRERSLPSQSRREDALSQSLLVEQLHQHDLPGGCATRKACSGRISVASNRPRRSACVRALAPAGVGFSFSDDPADYYTNDSRTGPPGLVA